MAFYSNKSRGMEKKEAKEENSDNINIPVEESTDSQKAYRRNWAGRRLRLLLALAARAILIQKVWEINPLICEKCGSPMKIKSIITDLDIVEENLNRFGLWNEQPVRAPPIEIVTSNDDGIEHIPYEGDWSLGYAE